MREYCLLHFKPTRLPCRALLCYKVSLLAPRGGPRGPCKITDFHLAVALFALRGASLAYGRFSSSSRGGVLI